MFDSCWSDFFLIVEETHSSFGNQVLSMWLLKSSLKAYSAVFLQTPHSFCKQFNTCSRSLVLEPVRMNFIFLQLNTVLCNGERHQIRKYLFILSILYFYLFENGKLLNLMWTRTLSQVTPVEGHRRKRWVWEVSNLVFSHLQSWRVKNRLCLYCTPNLSRFADNNLLSNCLIVTWEVVHGK